MRPFVHRAIDPAQYAFSRFKLSLINKELTAININ